MKYLKYIVFCVCIYIFYSMKSQNDYIMYKTLDAYTLQGINFLSGEIKKPYVLVKHDKDSIFILFSNQKNGIPTKYTRKDNYWYNITVEDNYCDPGFKCETDFNRCFEKYIYNDTIITYQYYKNLILNEDLNFGKNIFVETRDSRIWLALGTTKYIDPKNRFESVKYLVDNYEVEFPYNRHDSSYQPYWSEFYKKVLKGDTLYLFRNNGNNNYKFGCLYDIRKLSSLGEFDSERGESIIDKLNLRNHCE